MSKNLKVVLGIIAGIFLVAVLWQIRTIIYYVIISGILSLLASPLVKFLNGLSFKGIKLPNSVTAALTLVLMLCIFVGFISFFAPMIVAQAKAISQIDVVMVTQKLQGPIEE